MIEVLIITEDLREELTLNGIVICTVNDYDTIAIENKAQYPHLKTHCYEYKS